MSMRRKCHKCKGTGQIRAGLRKTTCDVCDGKSYVEIENVIPFVGVTRVDSDADNVLRHALGELDAVVIVG